jgi:HlyD family secretion protein
MDACHELKSGADMKTKWLFILAGLGALAGIASAIYYSQRNKPESPVYAPAQNPYLRGIYANGVIQSNQENGQDTALFAEVSGTVTQVFVKEGQSVAAGQPLLQVDDRIQRAAVEQLKAQAAASRVALAGLKAQPRPEVLAVASAQVDAATAELKTVQDELDKQERIYSTDPGLISRETLDSATNAVKVAQANLEVARRQYQQVKAGAWRYDIDNQTQTAAALAKSYEAAEALLSKYTIRAPVSGTVLSIQTAVGSYVSGQGTYDTIVQANSPLIVMGAGNDKELTVRCYVDEILIQRLNLSATTPARMLVRGTDVSVPLSFVRVQPYVSPKIELSNERAERVDLRVLPVIFKVVRPENVKLYPGQLVDVYIGN